jgi:outer membrane protein
VTRSSPDLKVGPTAAWAQLVGPTFRSGVRAAAIVVLAAAPLAAQDVLTVEDAVRRGLQHSARLAEIEAREAGAAAAADGRAAAKLPVVQTQLGYTRTNHVEPYVIAVPLRVLYPDVPDNYRARLDLQWPIYTAGRVDALERAARAEVAAVSADLAAAQADLRLEITRAYWAVATAREAERVVQRSVQNLDAHIGDLRERLKQGLIPPNDVLTAEAQRARQRVASIEASSTRAIAEADLRRLIGAPDGEPLPLAPLATPSEEISASAAAERAERRALNARLQGAREREQAAAALFKPQVALAAGYDVARPNPRIFPRADRWEDSWDVSINLAWTVWDGGRRAAERSEAAAAARGVEARITEFDRQLTFDLQARRLDVETAIAAIGAADEGIAAAVEARRVVDERYRAGVATATDVLDAQLAVLNAELDKTRALASARLADARLARVLGR